ncbi:hypothetical protein ACA081_00845, partial [Candidatus Hodgkinia cicadicola]
MTELFSIKAIRWISIIKKPSKHSVLSLLSNFCCLEEGMLPLPSIGNYKKNHNHNKKSSIDFGEVYCYKDLIKLSIFSLLFNKTIN